MESEDRLILIIVIVVILLWLVILIYRWLYAPKRSGMFFLKYAQPEAWRGRVVDLLEQHGYKVVYGKHKAMLQVVVDDDEERPYKSHLFYDYFAEKGRDLYAVKIARDRQTIRWSGSALRDQFLALLLIYDELAGVLYVDLHHEKVRKIVFVIDDDT